MGMKEDRLFSQWETGIVTHSAKETEAVAATFAQSLPPDLILTLAGDLGAGKTTFVRGLARGLGIKEDITSPSFALLHVYHGKRQLLHIDAYRLKQSSSFDDLMVWDIAQSPWNMVIEWPERVADRLPADHWKMKATILADGSHRFTLTRP